MRASKDQAGSLKLSDGTELLVRRSARARRMTIRVPRASGAAVLTLPVGASLSAARSFAEGQRDWLARHLDRQVSEARIAEGCQILFQGRLITLRHAPVRAARLEDGALLLPENRPEGASAAAFLRLRARDAILAEIDGFRPHLPRPPSGITLRDTRSRWGSCSANGRVMLSWRLIMAPPEVLRYVVAHELAHLRHMDHSPRFWAEVERLMPDHAPHRTWLRQHGAALQCWQFT